LITVFNDGADFIDPVSGITIVSGGSRKFATLQDAKEVYAISEALLDGTLRTDGHAGATMWLFDERNSFGSVDDDEWRARPINRLVSVPANIGNIAGDDFLVPAGLWSFSSHAAGKGNIRLVDVATNVVLATSTSGNGIITLYGMFDIQQPSYLRFEAYLTSGHVDAPESEHGDADGTKYTYLAAKFVCIK